MTERGAVKRSTRVAEAVRTEITDLLLRGSVRDPGAKDVFVSAVRVTDDLGIARIYIRLMDTDVTTARRERAVAAMERASGYLRREIGQRIRLQRTPSLEFFWDESVDDALRIEALLSEIRTEQSE